MTGLLDFSASMDLLGRHIDHLKVVSASALVDRHRGRGPNPDDVEEMRHQIGAIQNLLTTIYEQSVALEKEVIRQ